MYYVKKWMETLIEERSQALYSDKGERKMQAVLQTEGNEKVNAIKEVIQFYLDKNAEIEAISFAIRNVQTLSDFQFLWDKFSQLDIFQLDVNYVKHYANFVEHYLKDAETLARFEEGLFFSQLAVCHTPKAIYTILNEVYDDGENVDAYSDKRLFEVYCRSLVKNNFWGTYFAEVNVNPSLTPRWHEEAIIDWNQWKVGKQKNTELELQTINQLISTGNNEHALEHTRITLLLLDDMSPYINILKKIEDYIISKNKDSDNHSLWMPAWDLSIQTSFENGRFKEAYYMIKSFRILSGKEDGFNEYDEIIQRGFKYPNLKKGRSNFAKAFRAERIYENYEDAIRYFYSALEEEEKEGVIKNLVNLYYKIERKADIVPLLVEHESAVNDLKWYIFQLSRVYKTLGQHKNRLQLAESLFEKWGHTNKAYMIIEEYVLIMTEYYFLQPAINGFQQLIFNGSEINKKNNLVTLSRLKGFTKEFQLSFPQLDEILQIIQSKVDASIWEEVNNTAQNTEKRRFESMETVLKELKDYSDQKLVFTGNMHLKRVMQRPIPEQYVAVFEQLERIFSVTEQETIIKKEESQDETLLERSIDQFEQKVKPLIISNQLNEANQLVSQLINLFPEEPLVKKIQRRIQHLKTVPFKQEETNFCIANHLLLGLGDVESAIPYLEQSLKTEPKKERTIKVLTTSYYGEKTFDKLLYILKEYGHFIEDKEWLDHQLVEAYLHTEKYDEAIMILKSRLSKSIDHDQIIKLQMKISSIQIVLKNYDDALSNINSVIAKDSNHEEALLLKVTVLLETGYIKEADELFHQVEMKNSDRKGLDLIKSKIEKKRNEVIEAEQDLRTDFTEPAQEFNIKKIQQLIRTYNEVVSLTKDELYISRTPAQLTLLVEELLEKSMYNEALTTFLKMLIKNPNFPLLYTMIGKIFEEQKMVEAASSFYYISALMADKKKNWSIFTSFCLRNGLSLERVLGYMHLFSIDAADHYIQKELSINIRRTIFKQSIHSKSQPVLDEIVQFYNENFESFHVQSDQKTAQLVIGFTQFLKHQYKEAILLLEDHLDFNEKIQMAYHLLGKGELELATLQFQKLLNEDYQKFAKKGLDLIEIVKIDTFLPEQFSMLIEWLPFTPSMERIDDFIEHTVKEGTQKVFLKYLLWLQGCFPNDLPIRRAITRIHVSLDNIEEAYHSMYQTMTMGMHPNDFLHDIPELILYCFKYEMDYRVQKIVDYTQELRQETIVENSKDNRINSLKEDVKNLALNLQELKQHSLSCSEEVKSSFVQFLDTIQERHYKKTLNFIADVKNLEFLGNPLVWKTLYEFLYNKRFLSSFVREWFVSSFDELPHSNKLLDYVRQWNEDIYSLINFGRESVQQGVISEKDILILFNSLIDLKEYNALLLKSFEEYGSPKTEITMKIGEIIIGERIVAKAMAYYLANNEMEIPIEIEIALLKYCQKYQPNDYYIMRIGNIYFNEGDYGKAHSYFKQLTLEDSKYRNLNKKMILASELFDRMKNKEKYEGQIFDISSCTFFDLTTLVTYILKDKHIQLHEEEIIAYFERENLDVLLRLYSFNKYRIDQLWWDAFNVLTTFADQTKEFYQSALSYFIQKLHKHSAPEDVIASSESELNRLVWSKKEQLVTNVRTENRPPVLPLNEKVDVELTEFEPDQQQNYEVEENYLEEVYESEDDTNDQVEEKVSAPIEETNETEELEADQPGSIAEFSRYIPQIWRDFNRYTLDDRRNWDNQLIQLLKNEVDLAATEEVRAELWMKIAKLAHELGYEQDLLNALFQYGINEMKNASNLDMRFVRLYAYEILFIERFRKQERVNDENLVKSIMSTLLDALTHVKKVDELLSEGQNLRWITDNVNLGPAKLGLQAGMDRINNLLKSLEKFINTHEIDEKIILYNSLVVKNNDLSKGIFFKDFLIRRSFDNITKQWRRIIKPLNDSLYPRPKMDIKMLNDVSATNGVLFLEMKNIGEGLAENIQVALQEFDLGKVLGNKEYQIPMIHPKKSKAISIAVQFDHEGEFELSFNISYVDVQGKSTQLQESFIIKVENESKPFEDITDRYQPSVVTKTEDFFGRQDIIQRIHKNVSGGDYDKVVIIHGLRRVGKTSILYYLNETISDNLIPVFIDMQGLDNVESMAELIYFQFIDAIHHTFKSREGIILDMPDYEYFQVATMKKFYRYLDQLEEYLNGRKILFMIDEFEGLIKAVNNNKVDESIFAGFRHMMQHRNDCRFIIVGADKIVDMITDYASAIFSISLNIPVNFLELPDARKMIVSMTPEVRFTDTSLDRILELTNGHPYYTKILCSNVIQELNKQKRTTVYLNDVDKATNTVVTMTHGDYFKFLWDMFDPVEKLVVSYIAEKLKHTEEKVALEKIIQYFESSRDIESGELLIALSNLVNRNILNEISQSYNDRNSTEYYFSLDLYRESFKYNKPLVKTKIEVKEHVNF